MRVLVFNSAAAASTHQIPARFVLPVNTATNPTIDCLCKELSRRFSLFNNAIRLQLINSCGEPFDLLPDDRTGDVLRDQDSVLLTIIPVPSSAVSNQTQTPPKSLSNIPQIPTDVDVNNGDSSDSNTSDSNTSDSNTSDRNTTDRNTSDTNGDTASDSDDSSLSDSVASSLSQSDDSDNDSDDDEPPEEINTRVERPSPSQYVITADGNFAMERSESNDQLINISFRGFRRPPPGGKSILCGGQPFKVDELRYWNEEDLIKPLSDQKCVGDNRIRNVAYDWSAVCELNGLITHPNLSGLADDDSNQQHQQQQACYYDHSMVPKHKRKRLEGRQQQKEHKRFTAADDNDCVDVVVKDANDPIDYRQLDPCVEPSVGQKVAYQQWEMDMKTFTPRLSAYRHAEILAYNRLADSVKLFPIPTEAAAIISSENTAEDEWVHSSRRKPMPRQFHAAAFDDSDDGEEKGDSINEQPMMEISWNQLLNAKILVK